MTLAKISESQYVYQYKINQKQPDAKNTGRLALIIIIGHIKHKIEVELSGFRVDFGNIMYLVNLRLSCERH